jgi:hypothetical protein
MFLALQFISVAKCEYKLTGTVNPAPFKHRMFEQYTESETGNVFYIKIERTPRSVDGFILPSADQCLGILCGNTFTPDVEKFGPCTPEYLVPKHCPPSSDFSYSPHPFLNFMEPDLTQSIVSADASPSRFEKKVHKDSWLHSTVQTWSIYCVSPKYEDSSYLSFQINTSEYFDEARFDINFHYGSGKKSKFTNAGINLPSTPETCDAAFAMLAALPIVRDVILKADIFENI